MSCRAVLTKLGVNRTGCDPAGSGEGTRAAAEGRAAGEVFLAPALRQVMNEAQKEADKLKDEYISTEHLFLAMLKDRPDEAARLLDKQRRPGGGRSPGPGCHPGNAADHRPPAGGQIPGPPEIRPGPHRPGPAGKARPGHRPRGRDPAGHPGPVPPDQEQPGAHRRGRCGEDGHRRGPGPADRQRRRPPVAQEQAADRAGHRRRSSPAPSIGASSRTG